MHQGADRAELRLVFHLLGHQRGLAITPIVRAARDAFLAETISITVMEVTAIVAGLLLGVNAGLAAPGWPSTSRSRPGSWLPTP